MLFVKSLYYSIYHSIDFYSSLVTHIRGGALVGLFLPLSQEIVVFFTQMHEKTYTERQKVQSTAVPEDNDNSIKS